MAAEKKQGQQKGKVEQAKQKKAGDGAGRKIKQ